MRSSEQLLAVFDCARPCHDDRKCGRPSNCNRVAKAVCTNRHASILWLEGAADKLVGSFQKVQLFYCLMLSEHGLGLCIEMIDINDDNIASAHACRGNGTLIASY